MTGTDLALYRLDTTYAQLQAAGAQCTENNPCEVAADGTATVHKGQRYGQRTTMLPACLTAGSVLDLSAPGGTLTRPAA